MNLNRSKKNKDSTKHLQNKIKIWPMMTNPKPGNKKPDASPISQNKLQPLKPQVTLKPLLLPIIAIENSISEKQLVFPDISSFCSRLKDKSHKHCQSNKYLSFGSVTQPSELKGSFNQLEEINKFIKVCEIEKNSQKNKFIEGIENIQNEITNVAGIVQKLTSRPKPPNPKRRKENDYYITRVQIKKLINELRACTKHIGN